jgi:hypothetical protein
VIKSILLSLPICFFFGHGYQNVLLKLWLSDAILMSSESRACECPNGAGDECEEEHSCLCGHITAIQRVLNRLSRHGRGLRVQVMPAEI